MASTTIAVRPKRQPPTRGKGASAPADRSRTALAAIIALAGVGAHACAQAVGPDEPPVERVDTPSANYGLGATRWSASSFGRLMASSKARDTDGSLDTYVLGTELTGFVPWNADTSTVVSMGIGYHHFNWGGDLGLGSGTVEPLSIAYEARLNALTRHRFDDDWTFVGGLRAVSLWEDGADFVDGGTVGGIVGVEYQITPQIQLGAGVMISTRLEDSLSVIPLPIIDARFELSDSLVLELGTARGASLTFTPPGQDTWSVRGRVGWVLNDFRLDSEGAAPDGALSQFAIPVGVDLLWDFASGWRAEAGVSVNAFNRYELKNSDGFKIDEEEYGIAPELSLRVTYSF